MPSTKQHRIYYPWIKYFTGEKKSIWLKLCSTKVKVLSHVLRIHENKSSKDSVDAERIKRKFVTHVICLWYLVTKQKWWRLWKGYEKSVQDTFRRTYNERMTVIDLEFPPRRRLKHMRVPSVRKSMCEIWKSISNDIIVKHFYSE